MREIMLVSYNVAAGIWAVLVLVSLYQGNEEKTRQNLVLMLLCAIAGRVW